MQYLVTGEYVEPGPLLAPQGVVMMVENTVVPTLQMLAQMQSEGKIVAGGVQAGARTGTMIVEAGSNEEVDHLLGTLPIWGLLRWTIVPLVSFSGRAKWEAEAAAELKKTLQG